MSQDRQVLELLFKNLISRIGREKANGYFFETVIGCGEEFLEYVKEKEGIQNGIHISALKRESEEDGVFDIIRQRNDTEVKQCLIFTNRSIKDIDSLKDIGEREINALVDSEILDALIREQGFSIEKDIKYKKFRDFLNNLIACIAPGVPEMLTYIEKVEEFYNTRTKEMGERRLAWAANRNLHVFSMWSSACVDFLPKGKIYRIYLASKPTNIHKRISSIRQISQLGGQPKKEDSQQKLETKSFAQKNSRKKILTDMICNQVYQEAYEKIYYEYVEPLVGRKKKSENTSKGESDQDDDLEYIDKYMIALRYLCESEGMINEEVLEKQEITEDKVTAERSFTIPVEVGTEQECQIQYNLDIIEKKKQEVEKKFRWKPEVENGDARRKQYMQYLTRIENMCNDLNIPKEEREAIKERIREFRLSWVALKHTQKVPECIQTYVKETDKVYTAFYRLARYIMTMNTEMRQAVAASGLLEKIVNIDMKLENGNLYVSCYSPMMIFYLRQINNRNRSFFEYCNTRERLVYDYQLGFLEELNREIPNDVMWYDKKKYMYVRDNKKSRFPYYLRYKNVSSTASLETVNLLQTLKYVEDFRVNNLYKNEIRLCLIGDIHLESARLYIKRIGILLRSQELERIIIEIVTKTSDSIKTMLEEILDIRQGEEEGIEIRIENLSGKDYRNLRVKDYIQRNDMIFLLDSSFMYYEPRYVTGRPNNIRNLIQYQTLEQEKEYLGIPEEKTVFSAAVIPDIINCFQNASLEAELTPGVWDKYSLNTKPVMDIFDALRGEEADDKAVIFVSSDESIDTKLDNDQYLKSAREGKSGNKILKIIEWRSNYKTTANQVEKKGNGCIEVRLSDIMSVFPSSESLDNSIPDLKIRIYYGEFPEKITVQAFFGNFDSSNEEMIDQIHQILQQYLIDIITGDFWLTRMMRVNLYQILWNEAGSLEELMFVYALKQYSIVRVSYDPMISTDELPKSPYKSSLKRRTLNNNVMQLLDISGKEQMNYRMAERLDSFMKKSNHCIGREDCIFMADTLERFDKDKAILYTVDNIREYVKRKWGE